MQSRRVAAVFAPIDFKGHEVDASLCQDETARRTRAENEGGSGGRPASQGHCRAATIQILPRQASHVVRSKPPRVQLNSLPALCSRGVVRVPNATSPCFMEANALSFLLGRGRQSETCSSPRAQFPIAPFLCLYPGDEKECRTAPRHRPAYRGKSIGRECDNGTGHHVTTELVSRPPCVLRHRRRFLLHCVIVNTEAEGVDKEEGEAVTQFYAGRLVVHSLSYLTGFQDNAQLESGVALPYHVYSLISRHTPSST
ncbi:hypothetical protein MRX96_055383 [Rhipicephalus microplus]